MGIHFEFVELPPFASERERLFSEDEFLDLQLFLCEKSDAASVIPGTCGCRKLRWTAKGKGKRGGARIIYFLRISRGQIVLVTAFGKAEREDVPREWLRKIKEAFENEQGA
jgi:mRNA-degrading endonuclease RelE of RelBE toxin-antitoxin system